MRILILGGTQFIGRHLAESLLAGGHTVTIFNRGKSPDELPPGVERLRGDRAQAAAGLDALADRSWDACIDVSGYTPAQVRPSAERLRSRVRRYVFVSAVSVYGDPTLRPVRESHARLPPATEDVTDVNGDTYGPLKVACENIVQEVYADRCTLLRPQIVVGPHDQTARYSYWLRRSAQGGAMLAPGDGTDHLQYIDVRDVARFGRVVVENDLGGAFNLAGPRLIWREFLSLLGAENLVWVPKEIIEPAGLTPWHLPLFRPEHGHKSGLMDVCHQHAQASGLTLTEPTATARDVRAWIQGRDLPPTLLPEQEADLIRTALGTLTEKI